MIIFFSNCKTTDQFSFTSIPITSFEFNNSFIYIDCPIILSISGLYEIVKVKKGFLKTTYIVIHPNYNIQMKINLNSDYKRVSIHDENLTGYIFK